MTDRTQHLIDAIDGALDDWTVSGDAMRWTPEVKPPRQNGRGLLSPGPAVVPVVLFGDPVQRSLEAFETAMRRFVETMNRIAEQFAAIPVPVRDELVRRINAMQGLALDDESPRDRALRLRRERNTGPSRDLTRQRRPRRLQ